MQHLASCQRGEKAKQSQAAGTLCMVLLCSALRSDKQIALAQFKSAKPTCKILSCLGLSPLPQKIAQFKSEKPTRKICLGLANQILNIAKFDTSALDLKIVFTLLVFLIFSAGA